MKFSNLDRLVAAAVACAYIGMSTSSGGAGGFLVAAIVVGMPLIFIWYGGEVGRALAWSAEGVGLRLPGLVIRSIGWVLLAWLALGLLLNAPGTAVR